MVGVKRSVTLRRSRFRFSSRVEVFVIYSIRIAESGLPAIYRDRLTEDLRVLYFLFHRLESSQDLAPSPGVSFGHDSPAQLPQRSAPHRCTATFRNHHRRVRWHQGFNLFLVAPSTTSLLETKAFWYFQDSWSRLGKMKGIGKAFAR